MTRSYLTIFLAVATVFAMAGWKLFERYYAVIQQLDYIF